MRTTKRFIAAIALVVIASSARAGEFEWMVRQISHETGTRPMQIPFFGLARFVVRVGQPAGASDSHLAIFEDAHIAPARFTAAAVDSTCSSVSAEHGPAMTMTSSPPMRTSSPSLWT